VKLRFLIYLCLFFSLAQAQEKKDSIFKFYNYHTIQKSYSLDFEKKIKSDSVFFQTLDSLKSIGFYTLTLDSLHGNSVYLNKGKMYKRIWVKNDSIFQKNDEWFPVKNLDSLIQTVNQIYAAKGYPFTEIKIQPMGFREGEAQVALGMNLFAARRIDGVKVEGYEKLSKGYIRHALGLKKGKIYNEDELKKISEKMAYTTLIEEIRSPQTLFNTDSTTIYLYVKKVKSNVFDGVLGFGNNQEGKFQLNGNVKVELNNNFNGMERIRLNWIATPDKSSTLDMEVRVPYLFKSAVGTQTNFNMYRKDSVFVNTKIEERIFYQITANSNIGLNLSYENSNFVLDDHPELALMYDDYNKSGYGLSYELIQPISNPLLEGKSRIYFIGKTLTRKNKDFDEITQTYSETKTDQYELGIRAFHLFRLHPRHYVKAQIEGFGLFGSHDFYAQNELYRIGGFGSIRGFNEESISASTYGITSLEYRFVPNDGFYVAAFGDYGFIENKSAEISENLLGVGMGISFLTQLGVFNLSYAVGKQSDTGFDFRNSKIHFGILTRF
jgi:outer membrane protein assembly factor BamA